MTNNCNYFQSHDAPNSKCELIVALSGKKQVPFSMAIGNTMMKCIRLLSISAEICKKHVRPKKVQENNKYKETEGR